MRKKRLCIATLALCACLSLCGAGWLDSTKVAIDTENNRVYEYAAAENIIFDYIRDKEQTTLEYHQEYVLLTGKVQSVGKEGKTIVVSGDTNTQRAIHCTVDKALRNTALTYGKGDSIALYGQLKMNVWDKEIRLDAEKIVPIPTDVPSGDMYYLADGTSYNKKDTTKMELKDGRVEYYIPSFWEGIQHNITEENLGSMEGYQYVLNQMPGSKDTTPESLFVCYFDNKTQLADYLNDSDETELIEKAIVENILGKVGRFPSKEVKTYYGSKYTYYSGSFKNALETGAGYHTEFVFQADGDEGIVLVLYVYKDTKHLSDVLFLTRFLEIKGD